MEDYVPSPEEEQAMEVGRIFSTLKGTEEYQHFEGVLDQALGRLLLEAMVATDPLGAFSLCQRARQVLDMRGMADGAISEGGMVTERVREAYEASQRGAAVSREQALRQRSAARAAAEGYSRPQNQISVDARLRR